MKTSLFTNLTPILKVKDLQTEIDFYKCFGFEISYQGDEFPGFVGLQSGSIEFGLEQDDHFDPKKATESFVWQMVTTNMKALIEICEENGYTYDGPHQYWPERDAWEIYISTPNGYRFQAEKEGRDW